MKTTGLKSILFTAFTAISLAFTACNNAEKDREATDNYNRFVTRVENERDKWDTDTAYWLGVEREYDSLNASVSSGYDKMDEAGRKEIDDIRRRYDKVKGEYMTAKEQRATAEKRKSREAELRIAIFGAEATADLSNVNGENIRSYYEKLVTTVEKNQEAYTPDDWDAIKAWYEKLDALKNKFERNGLSSKDNLAIAELKIKYNAIAKPERLESKIEQKVEEQEEKHLPGKE